MYYFIPSWYSGEHKWAVETPYWFRVFENMSFDDTVNQLKMFQNLKEESAILLLSYQPQLRYFVHKQGLLNSPYWSFFDDIQNIRREETSFIDFKEFEWPQGVRFVYTPFKVVVMEGEVCIADVHFAENGNLLQIHFLDGEKETKRLQFDDRGFLSSIRYYKDGIAAYQDYLNEFGVWQVRELLTSKEHKLEVNPQSDKRFRKAVYQDWEELFAERLEVLKTEVLSEQDTLVVASDIRHNDLVLDQFKAYKKIFSFFGDRFDLTNTPALARVMAESDLIVIDSEALELALQQEVAKHSLVVRNMTRVTPFDTRLRLGQSQTIKELIIYFLIDGLSKELVDQAIAILLDVMEENPAIELHLLTYERNHSMKQLSEQLLEKIRKGYSLERFVSVESKDGENQLEEDESLELSAIKFLALNNENQIIEELDLTRLVIDLSPNPHLYTQIASISAGIPQINRVPSEYVSHMENGWIIRNMEELSTAVGYYFDGLSNWNRSLVYTVQKMGDYTSGKIIAKWKELLEDRT
ncbi:accessory Sec system protein Asp1 [Streptococcus suis]